MNTSTGNVLQHSSNSCTALSGYFTLTGAVSFYSCGMRLVFQRSSPGAVSGWINRQDLIARHREPGSDVQSMQPGLCCLFSVTVGNLGCRFYFTSVRAEPELLERGICHQHESHGAGSSFPSQWEGVRSWNSYRACGGGGAMMSFS